MSKKRDHNSSHPIAKILKSKGYKDFEYSGSQMQNQWSGWWIESSIHKEIDGVWLGQTLKDSIHNLKHTNKIPIINQ